jgi:hypothetical protein
MPRAPMPRIVERAPSRSLWERFRIALFFSPQSVVDVRVGRLPIQTPVLMHEVMTAVWR